MPEKSSERPWGAFQIYPGNGPTFQPGSAAVVVLIKPQPPFAGLSPFQPAGFKETGPSLTAFCPVLFCRFSKPFGVLTFSCCFRITRLTSLSIR
jgi:hypothetical protein